MKTTKVYRRLSVLHIILFLLIQYAVAQEDFRESPEPNQNDFGDGENLQENNNINSNNNVDQSLENVLNNSPPEITGFGDKITGFGDQSDFWNGDQPSAQALKGANPDPTEEVQESENQNQDESDNNNNNPNTEIIDTFNNPEASFSFPIFTKVKKQPKNNQTPANKRTFKKIFKGIKKIIENRPVIPIVTKHSKVYPKDHSHNFHHNFGPPPRHRKKRRRRRPFFSRLKWRRQRRQRKRKPFKDSLYDVNVSPHRPGHDGDGDPISHHHFNSPFPKLNFPSSFFGKSKGKSKKHSKKKPKYHHDDDYHHSPPAHFSKGHDFPEHHSGGGDNNQNHNDYFPRGNPETNNNNQYDEHSHNYGNSHGGNYQDAEPHYIQTPHNSHGGEYHDTEGNDHNSEDNFGGYQPYTPNHNQKPHTEPDDEEPNNDYHQGGFNQDEQENIEHSPPISFNDAHGSPKRPFGKRPIGIPFYVRPDHEQRRPPPPFEQDDEHEEDSRESRRRPGHTKRFPTSISDMLPKPHGPPKHIRRPRPPAYNDIENTEPYEHKHPPHRPFRRPFRPRPIYSQPEEVNHQEFQQDNPHTHSEEDHYRRPYTHGHSRPIRPYYHRPPHDNSAENADYIHHKPMTKPVFMRYKRPRRPYPPPQEYEDHNDEQFRNPPQEYPVRQPPQAFIRPQRPEYFRPPSRPYGFRGPPRPPPPETHYAPESPAQEYSPPPRRPIIMRPRPIFNPQPISNHLQQPKEPEPDVIYGSPMKSPPGLPYGSQKLQLPIPFKPLPQNNNLHHSSPYVNFVDQPQKQVHSSSDYPEQQKPSVYNQLKNFVYKFHPNRFTANNNESSSAQPQNEAPRKPKKYSTLPEHWEFHKPDPSHNTLPKLTYDAMRRGGPQRFPKRFSPPAQRLPEPRPLPPPIQHQQEVHQMQQQPNTIRIIKPSQPISSSSQSFPQGGLSSVTKFTADDAIGRAMILKRISSSDLDSPAERNSTAARLEENRKKLQELNLKGQIGFKEMIVAHAKLLAA